MILFQAKIVENVHFFSVFLKNLLKRFFQFVFELILGTIRCQAKIVEKIARCFCRYPNGQHRGGGKAHHGVPASGPVGRAIPKVSLAEIHRLWGDVRGLWGRQSQLAQTPRRQERWQPIRGNFGPAFREDQAVWPGLQVCPAGNRGEGHGGKVPWTERSGPEVGLDSRGGVLYRKNSRLVPREVRTFLIPSFPFHTNPYWFYWFPPENYSSFSSCHHSLTLQFLLCLLHVISSTTPRRARVILCWRPYSFLISFRETPFSLDYLTPLPPPSPMGIIIFFYERSIPSNKHGTGRARLFRL